jgi:hypothetical protein
MAFFDKLKETASNAKEKATSFAEEKQLGEKFGDAKGSVLKAFGDVKDSLKEQRNESNLLKQPLEGSYRRYEVTYIGGIESLPKSKSGAIGLNIMPDMFSFRPTYSSKDWFTDLDIPYDKINDIRIEKRTISTAEIFLGGCDNANQEQENNIVIEYVDKNNTKQTLRTEMLTGVTIFNQTAKCREFMDLLRQKDILENIESKKKPNNTTGNTDILEQLEKLSKLKDSGIISEEEFNQKKKTLLDKL